MERKDVSEKDKETLDKIRPALKEKYVPVSVDLLDLAYLIAHEIDPETVGYLIMEIDQQVQDWDFTYVLCEYFKEEMKKEAKAMGPEKLGVTITKMSDEVKEKTARLFVEKLKKAESFVVFDKDEAEKLLELLGVPV